MAIRIVRYALLVGVACCLRVTTGPVVTSEIWPEDVRFMESDGTRIYGRLYLPPSSEPMPAVVVCHGHLANVGFMQVPWAADLTHLGIASLFLDRRGHGYSSGQWWPGRPKQFVLSDQAPEILAAVSYLRSRVPFIDPSRIALLGHSDGATGAIAAASEDWDITATVSLSASAAPSDFVNHVAPMNLLLLYGTEDRFVLQNTDELLIWNATRGYLDHEGSVGDLQDGSARRLERIVNRGHVDLLYSPIARYEALKWLAGALNIQRPIQLSAVRTPWTIAGVILLGLVFAGWNGLPDFRSIRGPWACCLRSAIVTAAWIAGIALAAWYHLKLTRIAPAQGGAVVVAVLSTWLLVGTALVVITDRTTAYGTNWSQYTPRIVGITILLAIAFDIVFEFLLHPVFETPLDWPRAGLFLTFLAIAAPSLVSFELCVTWAANGASSWALEFLIAGITALLGSVWFPRMAALPVYLLACAVALTGAYRIGRLPAGPVGAGFFGALLYARCMSFVCAWY